MSIRKLKVEFLVNLHEISNTRFDLKSKPLFSTCILKYNETIVTKIQIVPIKSFETLFKEKIFIITQNILS